MLRFFLRPRGKHLLELASPGGAGRNKTLGQGEFAKLKIVVPSIDEQRKIAAALQAVDDKLTALRRKRERLTTYKRGLMQQLFSQELRFTRADGRPFPDWEVRRLGEITKINMGQSPSSETYNNLAQGLPLIQGNADISNRTTSPRRFTTSPTKICNIGDIIMSVRAPVGEIAYSLHSACIGRGVCSLRASHSIEQKFLYHWLIWFEPQWRKIGQGSTFTAISGSDIKRLNLNLPHIEEQQKIADCLTAVDDKINAVAQQIDQIDTFKKGLLQQMFV